MPTYRILALDIDGTLTNSQGHITSGVKEAIHRAQRHGYIIFLVSGRRSPHVKDVAEHLTITSPFVSFNGAVVMDGTSREALCCHTLELAPLHEVIHLWQEEAFTVFAYGNGLVLPNLYTGEPTWGPTRHKIAEEGTTLRQVTSLINCTLPVVRLMVADQQHVAQRAQTLAAPYLCSSLTRSLFTTDHQGLWIFEILPRTGKAEGLAFLSQQQGIKPEEIIAVGDDINDVDMLQWAGWGVAMGNADPAVKAVADTVIGRHDDDGLAQFIHAIIDGYTPEAQDPLPTLRMQKG